ncbi:STAS domain-containing protein [Candidatus Gracilibacteria bacterium]|nr:STAS domain-containing protein [Candidatus Gracilibacteria bacterium]
MSTNIEISKTVSNVGIRVYSFSGELDEMNVDNTFTDIINDIGDFTEARIVFHFGNLQYINSKGIGWIADIYQKTKDGGGIFVICSPRENIKDTLELDGISTIVPVHPNERSAVEEFIK